MHIYKTQKPHELALIRAHIASYMTKYNINQSQLSIDSKVSQPIISRLLSGHSLRTSKNIVKLYDYAFSKTHLPYVYEPSKDIELINALFAAIDFNPKKARTVRRVLEAFTDI